MKIRSTIQAARTRISATLTLGALGFVATVHVAGCEPTATVGAYQEVGVPCDPLSEACGTDAACTLRADPTMDACRDVAGITADDPCDGPDACAAGAQCAVIDGVAAQLDPLTWAHARCLPVCARDVPRCPGARSLHRHRRRRGRRACRLRLVHALNLPAPPSL